MSIIPAEAILSCDKSIERVNHWCSGAFINESPESFFAVPVLWNHGHTHTSLEYQVGNCRADCNPRGYRNQFSDKLENSSFDPNFVVEV